MTIKSMENNIMPPRSLLAYVRRLDKTSLRKAVLRPLGLFVPLSLALPLFCLTSLFPSYALAQAVPLSGGLDLQLFKPVQDNQGLVITQGSDVLPHLDLTGGFFLNFSRNPFELADPTTGSRSSGVVDGLTAGDLVMAMGILDVASVHLTLPVTMNQDRSGALFDSNRSASGFNDIVLGGKYRLPFSDHLPIGLALTADITLPSGNPDKFLGAQSWTLEGAAIVDMRPLKGLHIATNLGFKFRAGDNATIGNLSVDDQVTYRLGAGYDLSETPVIGDTLKKWEATAEIFGSTVASNFFNNPRESPAEMLLSARRHTDDNVVLSLGFGTGLNPGVGTPDYRIVMGFSFVPFEPPPPIPCPVVAGPAPCPVAPPCPEPEACPVCPTCDAPPVCEFEGPEDMDGFQDDDNCPDPDNDQDGIVDFADNCPLIPEDLDGVEDDDGCPEFDNDKDGINDNVDRCPEDPEDMDGFQDEDGCPELDNDKDYILDTVDKCPLEAEDFDGFEDDDGCPEEGEGKVKIVNRKIEILDKIFFASGSDVIQMSKSGELLKQVVDILIANKWVELVEIQGHTDASGNDAYNLDLSQRRAKAVRVFLVSQGIEESRVEFKGYGETKPIQSNSTAEGRAANRRVIFQIKRVEGQTDGVEIKDSSEDTAHTADPDQPAKK